MKTFDPTPPSGPPAPPGSRVWRASLTVAGGLLVLTGGAVLLAWAAGSLEYVQIDPGRPPMHYNVAAGFVVCGAGFVALALGRFRVARRCGAALLVLGVVLSAAEIPALGLRLDGWAFVPPPTCPPFPPGGAAPTVSVALALIGAVLVVTGRRDASAGRGAFATLFGAVLVAGGGATLIAVFGEPAVGWTSRMPVLGAAAVAVAGLGLLPGVFRRGTPAFVAGRTLSLAVGVVGVVAALFLWVGLDADQDRRIGRQVQFETAHLHRSAQDRLAGEVNALTGLAERWGRTDPEQMWADASNYVGQQPACLGVARVGPDAAVSWVEVRQRPAPPTTLDALGVAGPVVAALREGRVVAARPPRSAWKGARVLVVFAPHAPGTAAGGGLLAVFRLQEFFDTAINSNLAHGYAIRVTENGEAVFTRFGTDAEYRGRWDQTLPLDFHGLDWRLSVWPTRAVLERESLSLPTLALVVGLGTTALLALAVHLARTARRRAAALEAEVRAREAARHALTRSEEKYRTLIENLGQGIFLQDRDHRFVAANAQYCRTVGRTEAEIVGRTAAELFDPRRAAAHATEAETVLADGRGIETEDDQTVDGRRACVRRVLTPVRDAAGRTTGVLGICWDVTEQRRLEAHVHQASKMDAIGQLAGGIAHDFNNLLTAILGNLDLIAADLPPGEPCGELAAAAQAAATRAASLTQRLLGFSRRHQLDWVPTDLTGVVGEVVALLRRTINPLVRIETRFAPGPWPVLADPTQLNQVLMNLCLNARDAIAGAGVVTIETACVSAAAPAGGDSPEPGDFVRLSVADTGAGMTDEVKARLYEPFFTTKEVGKGTGLGLPMVFAIVRQHKGWIDCWTEPGRGTRFDIYLPRAEAEHAAAAPGPVAPSPHREGRGTVLVVDDEEMIRRVAVLTLEARGYTVLEAADGQEAVDVCAREGSRIDLVLLDLTMPVLSGHEAFRHILRLDPHARVLFASGYAAEQLSDDEKESMAGFVQKPYRPAELTAAVEAALRPHGGPPARVGCAPHLATAG